jgi:hypothetical protein
VVKYGLEENVMANRKTGLFVLVLVAMVTTMVFVGCIDNNKSLVIVHNVVLDDECEYKPDPEYIRTRGFLDLNHPAYGTPGEPRYYFFPQVNNYMPTNLSTCNCELDAMAIQLRKATISYEWLIGRGALETLHPELLSLEEGQIDIYLSGVVAPAGSGGDPGQFVTHLRLIPPDVGTRLVVLGTEAEEFVLGVHVTIKGTTLGGVDIDSNEFVYPIEFCWDCLNRTCPDGTYPACYPGQDANPLECEEQT